MSTGLELIPIGIMLVGVLSKSLKDRAKNASETSAPNLMTRMVDPSILRRSLESENLEFLGTDDELTVNTGEGTIQMVRSEGLNYGVVMTQLDHDGSVDLLQRIEERYCSIFQEHLATQMETNASSLGYPVHREVTDDETIRLRITVS
jgi:hypothetical protein